MKEISPDRYEVERGELITINITAHSVAAMIAASVDGAQMKFNPTLSFIASKPVAQAHDVQLFLSFPSDAPSDARYDVEVTGSGGGSFESSITRTTSPVVKTLTFFVGDTGPK